MLLKWTCIFSSLGSIGKGILFKSFSYWLTTEENGGGSGTIWWRKGNRIRLNIEWSHTFKYNILNFLLLLKISPRKTSNANFEIIKMGIKKSFAGFWLIDCITEETCVLLRSTLLNTKYHNINLFRNIYYFILSHWIYRTYHKICRWKQKLSSPSVSAELFLLVLVELFLGSK